MISDTEFIANSNQAGNFYFCTSTSRRRITHSGTVAVLGRKVMTQQNLGVFLYDGIPSVPREVDFKGYFLVGVACDRFVRHNGNQIETSVDGINWQIIFRDHIFHCRIINGAIVHNDFPPGRLCCYTFNGINWTHLSCQRILGIVGNLAFCSVEDGVVIFNKKTQVASYAVRGFISASVIWHNMLAAFTYGVVHLISPKRWKIIELPLHVTEASSNNFMVTMNRYHQTSDFKHVTERHSVVVVGSKVFKLKFDGTSILLHSPSLLDKASLHRDLLLSCLSLKVSFPLFCLLVELIR
jgi:hypothetical protein